jgi:hypothetical protein
VSEAPGGATAADRGDWPESAKKVGGAVNQMRDADRSTKRPSEADGCYRLLTSKEGAVIEAGFDDRR